MKTVSYHPSTHSHTNYTALPPLKHGESDSDQQKLVVDKSTTGKASTSLAHQSKSLSVINESSNKEEHSQIKSVGWLGIIERKASQDEVKQAMGVEKYREYQRTLSDAKPQPLITSLNWEENS